jgi:hypothetical protein
VVPEQNATIADAAAIRSDLEFMTARWPELGQPAVMEIRAFKENAQPQIAKFAPDWMDEAVDWVESMNGLGFNIYAVRNPIRADLSGSAKDTDIIGAFFLWADCDDPAAAGNVYRFDGPKWSAAVTTGSVPSVRVHTYWSLETPITDMAEWRAMQEQIAAHFGSDRAVVNPSRIMRVGGTVSYPAAHKLARGYVKELTIIRTKYDEERPAVTLEQMRRVFGQSAPAAPRTAPPSSFDIDTGALPTLDRERTAIQAMSGQDWNNAVLRLVGSYVRKGLSDGEIHALTDPLTLAGYTVDQTRAEVQDMINRTRANPKFEIEQTYTPNFDHAPAPTPTSGAPKVDPWTLQTAAAFTSDFVAPEYIVDGVIQRGRLYTLTAPTGSGKTAVMLYAAMSIAQGELFYDRDVEQGDVLFMAGENPDDVRARVIATMEYYNIDPAKCRVHFIPGTFSIRADLERLKEEAAKLPNLVLVVIDTFAAYFDGDDENSNAQALDFARVARRLTTLPSKPAVVMPAHPVKNASRSNLSPKGGSSLVNEVDGNLTLWNEGGIVTMHWQVKFRGAEFEPLAFELQRYETDKIKDAKGRRMPTILAKPMLMMRASEISNENMTLEDRLLLSIHDDPAMSLAGRAATVGAAHKMKVKRALEKLQKQKLIRMFRTNWELTKDGEKAVEMITNGDKFAPEIDP